MRTVHILALTSWGLSREQSLLLVIAASDLPYIQSNSVMFFFSAPDRGNLLTLVVGSNKQRSLLITGHGIWSVYDKKPQRYAEDNRTAFN